MICNFSVTLIKSLNQRHQTMSNFSHLTLSGTAGAGGLAFFCVFWTDEADKCNHDFKTLKDEQTFQVLQDQEENIRHPQCFQFDQRPVGNNYLQNFGDQHNITQNFFLDNFTRFCLVILSTVHQENLSTFLNFGFEIRFLFSISLVKSDL